MAAYGTIQYIIMYHLTNKQSELAENKILLVYKFSCLCHGTGVRNAERLAKTERKLELCEQHILATRIVLLNSSVQHVSFKIPVHTFH